MSILKDSGAYTPYNNNNFKEENVERKRHFMNSGFDWKEE
jgi:hypothetical protein